MLPFEETLEVRVERPPERALGYRDAAPPGELRITCPWGWCDAIAAVPICGGVSVISVSLAVVAYGLDASIPGSVWVALVGLATVSVGLAYASLALMVDRTMLVLNDEHLSCTHRPLPWPGGSLVLPIDDVLAFTIEKRAPEVGDLSFDVIVTTPRGPITLVRRIPELRSAVRMIEALSAHLGAVAPTDVDSRARPSGAAEARASVAAHVVRLARSPS